VDALVLNIDGEQKKFSLSIKRLKQDPWKGLVERYRVGDVVEGYVTSITDFGIFVEIEDGIEGLIHLSEIESGKGKHPSELFNIDDMVKATVINVDEKDKRIGLSTKALKKTEEKRDVASYSREEARAFSTLGDLLEPAIKKSRNDE
jgi:small subunit ribosomal protein S1